jgi:hypothetical protein
MKNEAVKQIIHFAIRIFLYSALMIGLYLVMMFDAQHQTSTGKFGEICATEALQELFLVSLGFMFIIAGRREREMAPLSGLISLFFFMAAIRELNNLIPFWFYLTLPLILLFCWFLYRDRKSLVQSMASFLKTPSLPWFMAGFLVTFVFSRFFGKKVFWSTLTGGDYNRWIKNAAEEGMEMVGYTFLLIGGIEMLLYLGKKKWQTKK